MKAIGIAVLMILALPVVWLGSAFIYETWDTYSHRFRLSIAVDDDGVTKTASSVIQVNVTGKASWVPQSGGTFSGVRGEAVFLDLGGGRNLVAILGFGANGSDDIVDHLAPWALGRDRPFWYREAPSWQGRAELTGRLQPTLVTFADLADPRTARVVRPEEFAAVFGQGVRFKGAWIEMTRDPVTRGIAGKMSWLPHPQYLSGKFACAPTEPHCLHGGHFTR